MGLRGPAPKPAELREFEGLRAHRPLPREGPQYARAQPEKPKRISPAARAVWDDLVGEMAAVRILRRVDRNALWQLCEDEALIAEAYAGIWKTIRAVKAKARSEGRVLPTGAVMAMLSTTGGRMAMAAVRDLSARVILERREFGLTPSSRSRVEADGFGGSAAMDPIEEKLCGNLPN